MTHPAMDQLEAAMKHFRSTQSPELIEAMGNFCKALGDAAQVVPISEIHEALNLGDCPHTMELINPDAFGSVQVRHRTLPNGRREYGAQVYVPTGMYSTEQLGRVIECLCEVYGYMQAMEDGGDETGVAVG